MSITLSDGPAKASTTPRRRRGPCTFKQRDVTAAVRAVIKAGVEIRDVKIAPDGNILVSVGHKPETAPENDWDNI